MCFFFSLDLKVIKCGTSLRVDCYIPVFSSPDLMYPLSFSFFVQALTDRDRHGGQDYIKSCAIVLEQKLEGHGVFGDWVSL